MQRGHVDDVYVMTNDMIEACDDLVQAGRIDRDDRDGVADMRLRLRDAESRLRRAGTFASQRPIARDR